MLIELDDLLNLLQQKEQEEAGPQRVKPLALALPLALAPPYLVARLQAVGRLPVALLLLVPEPLLDKGHLVASFVFAVELVLVDLPSR